MSSTKKLSAEKYSALPFFKFTLRHNLQHLTLYLVIAVLAMVLPTMLVIDDYRDYTERDSSWDYTDVVADNVTVIGGLGLFVAGGIAVIAGMSTGAYVNSKTGVGCYHSFPLKREVLLGCESLTRLIYFGAAAAFGYVVPYLIMFAVLPSEGVIAGSDEYWKFALISVFVFLIVYSLFLFAGGLTGNAVTRFLMAVIIVCIPAALYALIVTLASMGCNRLYDSYYLNEEILRKIFVPLRGYKAVENVIYNNSFGLLLTTLIDTAFYTAGAFLLQKYRKSEASGTSIIWKPVFLAVKLIVVIVSTLFGGWFLSAAMGMSRSVSLIIGAVIGGVLSFIVANCILYRSSRAMFKGLKSFGITMAALFVFILIVPLNVTGLIGNFYSADATDEFIIRMTTYGTEITFDEPDEVAMIYALLTDEESMYSGESYPVAPLFNSEVHRVTKHLDVDYKLSADSKYAYNIEKDGVSIFDNDNGVATYPIIVIQKPKFGLPLAIDVDSDVNSVFTDTVTSTEKFAASMNIAGNVDFDDIGEMEIHLDSRTLYFYRDFYSDDHHHVSFSSEYGDHENIDDTAMYSALENIIENAAYDSKYRTSSPVVGQIVVYCDTDEMMETNVYASREKISLPVYADDVDLIDAIEHAMMTAYASLDGKIADFKPIESAEEYYSRALARSDLKYENRVTLLVNCRTGEYAELDKETLIELAGYTSGFISSADYYARSYELIGSSDYIIIYQRDDIEDCEIRFRRGADIDDKLAEIIANK